MKKKLLSLIMAGAMAASLMAGCGVSTDTGAGSGSDSTGGDTASTATIHPRRRGMKRKSPGLSGMTSMPARTS